MKAVAVLLFALQVTAIRAWESTDPLVVDHIVGDIGPNGCPILNDFQCVRHNAPCTAVETCKIPYEVECGHQRCAFPYVCKDNKREVCSKYFELKEKCSAPKHVCQKILTPCGPNGLACGFEEQCVKRSFCRSPTSRGLKWSGDGGVSGSGSVFDPSSGQRVRFYEPRRFAVGQGRDPYYYGRHGYYDPNGLDNCEDRFFCAKTDPCREVVSQKCISKNLRERYYYSGWQFDWMEHWDASNRCGNGFCEPGFRCANVLMRDCSVYESRQCGDGVCDAGYECAAAYEPEECNELEYLKTVCEDADVPTCVPLPQGWQRYVEAPCETVFRCDSDGAICGNEICAPGSICSVQRKEVCPAPTYVDSDIIFVDDFRGRGRQQGDPSVGGFQDQGSVQGGDYYYGNHGGPAPEPPVEPVPNPVPPPQSQSPPTARATTTSAATDKNTVASTLTDVTGKGVAGSQAGALSPLSSALAASAADGKTQDTSTATQTASKGVGGGLAQAVSNFLEG